MELTIGLEDIQHAIQDFLESKVLRGPIDLETMEVYESKIVVIFERVTEEK